MPSANEECGAFFVYKTRGVKVVNPYQLGARIRVQGIIPCREYNFIPFDLLLRDLSAEIISADLSAGIMPAILLSECEH